VAKDDIPVPSGGNSEDLLPSTVTNKLLPPHMVQ